MARPRKPTSVLELTGAFKQNPQRRAERAGEPQPTGKLGDPPPTFSDAEKATWWELYEIIPPKVATNADRWVVELACRIMCKVREDGIGGKYGASVGELSQLMQCLIRLGMTPADRSKISIAKDDDEANPFAELASEEQDTVN